MNDHVALERTDRFDAIDGLRAYSTIGIVMMHVLSNCNYIMHGFIWDSLIPSFTNLVFLFMVISAFSMCCGYYEKFHNNTISLETFYNKRFLRIWPFFAMLCILDFIVAPSTASLYEVVANLTLCFGLLPNPSMSVIGVGWFLGVVFVFYMVFPFYCYLISNKKRAWFVLIISVLFNHVAATQFGATRTNFVYCMPFFVVGGIVYIYRIEIEKLIGKYRGMVFALCVGLICLYFQMGASVYIMLLLFSAVLIYSIGVNRNGILINPMTKFLSDISMEVYLGHMMVFRIMEKMNIIYLFGHSVISYIFVLCTTLLGTIVFALVAKKTIKLLFIH